MSHCNCGAPVGFGGVHDVGAKGCRRDIFGQAAAPTVERMRTATDGIRAMHAAEVDSLRAEIGRLQKIVESFSGRRNATPDALDRLRHAAAAVCNSEGIPLDDDMVEVRADRLSELRKELDNGAAVEAEKTRITDLRRAARSVVQAWQVERADRFSADWHAEFRCLENALRAFPNPIIVPKERPACPECKGDLGGVEIGRIEEHRKGCSRMPR